jgi:hypothetical protein
LPSLGLLICAAVLGTIVSASAVPSAPSIDQQAKTLSQRYAQVEDQLSRSVCYGKKDEADGATTAYRAWFDRAGEPIKVAVERTDASGRELTEYFAPDFENADAGMVSEIMNDGLITLNVTGQESSGERKGDVDFSVDQKLRMRETPSGLRLETVNVRNAPPE